ncbi:hypothetical protein ABBQ32_001599 [Trebouxia sp. C0010 RCD-2024]
MGSSNVVSKIKAEIKDIARTRPFKGSLGNSAFWSSKLAALLSICSGASNFTDVDILNFALNLECLESEFYSWVAYGKGLAAINSSLVGSGSALTASSSGGVARSGGSAFSATAVAIATEIAENEVSHVTFLRDALTAAGATPVPCPALSLSPATFTTAAKAAVAAINATISNTTSATAFNPYASEDAFYLGAYIFEDVGVTAYKGAVQVLQSQAFATVAAGIEAVEAGHAAIIRDQMFQVAGSPTGLTLSNGGAIDFQTAVIAINALRDALGGTSSSTVEAPLTKSTAPDLFAADANSVAYTRIPRQVLNIVYFGTSAGGFFPQGIAGNTNVANVTGAATTASKTTCTSGALSMASASAAMLFAGLAVVYSLV